VSSLILAVTDALAARFSVCTVQGELSGFSRAASGHCYFSLKDAEGGDSLIRCAMFRRAASLLDFAPKDGQRVQVRGRMSVYQPRGELQFVVESMQHASAEGALMERFLRLKAQLEAEGLFAAERKKPLPAYPRRIGVVTSLGAAALHDVLTAFARRAPHVEVIVYPSLVQGAQAPETIVQAIRWACDRDEVDTLLLCRGGGSLEDLWAFNDERVVRAIAACHMPVVCGVGHETDVTLADFAADLRAPTPTAAAEMAAPATEHCLARLESLAQQLHRRVNLRLNMNAQRLDHLALRWSKPAEWVRKAGQRLQVLAFRMMNVPSRLQDRQASLLRTANRLHNAKTRVLQNEQRSLQVLGSRLQSLDPRQVLSRGYAWLADADGQPLCSVKGVVVGQGIQAVLGDGELGLRIDSVRHVEQGEH
jgi:exodeoxyribonuclease VII large subunit